MALLASLILLIGYYLINSNISIGTIIDKNYFKKSGIDSACGLSNNNIDDVLKKLLKTVQRQMLLFQKMFICSIYYFYF